MPYSLRSRTEKSSADTLKKVVVPKKAKLQKEHTVESNPASSKNQIEPKAASSKVQAKPIIRPSLPISDAKQRLIKELSFVKGKPSEVKRSANQKKKVILHKIDFSSSGKIEKKSRPNGKQLGKIVFAKIRKQPNIQPSIVKARANPTILAIKTEIMKKAVMKEIRKVADKNPVAKSPVKSPLKGR
jgi:hypothetical protein